MDDYIRRKDIYTEIMGQHPDAHYPDWYGAIIKSIPAADVRPVVRSKWEVVEKGLRYEIWKCKRCGDLLNVRKDTFNCGRGNCFFCPRCGADMREEADNATD